VQINDFKIARAAGFNTEHEATSLHLAAEMISGFLEQFHQMPKDADADEVVARIRRLTPAQLAKLRDVCHAPLFEGDLLQ